MPSSGHKGFTHSVTDVVTFFCVAAGFQAQAMSINIFTSFHSQI